MELTDDGKSAQRGHLLVSAPTGQLQNSSIGSAHFLVPARRFDPEHPEWIDRPGTDTALLREELQLMARGNADFGVLKLLLSCLKKMLGPASPKPITILDLATGSADIPRAVASWFRTRGQPVVITAVDRSPEILRLAAEDCRDFPEIHLEQRDALNLPYAAGSFDLVLCNQALHHFGAADAVRVLRQMWEISRVGCLVNDFRRSLPAIWLVELAVRAFIKSPIVRHDAPQSCRAAFTVAEMQELARRAGMDNFNITRHHGGFRMILEARK